MRKIAMLLVISFYSFSAKSQGLPVNVKNSLQEYFFIPIQFERITDCTSFIDMDSSIIIDTTVSRESNDSLYFYLRGTKKNFISKINGAATEMVIEADITRFLDKKSMILQMVYYFDTTENSKSKTIKEFNNLDKKFGNIFYSVRESHSKNSKKNGQAMNYYLKNSSIPALIIKWGKFYRNKAYCVAMTIMYQLE